MTLRKSCIYYTTVREGNNWYYAYCMAKKKRERGKKTEDLCDNCTAYERDQDYDPWKKYLRD